MQYPPFQVTKRASGYLKPIGETFHTVDSWKSRFTGNRHSNAPLDGSPPVLGRIQTLETRLARSRSEIQAAQALRYEVFYREMSATADVMTRVTKRDKDKYDRICDHLLVIDRDRPEHTRTVGTYRFLRQKLAEENGGFYSGKEYDLEPVLRRNAHLEFLELGRSCVLPAYRCKRTVELLWQGIWTYVLRHKVDVMIGCASLEGTDLDKLALPLSFLHHHARAPKDWRIKAVPGSGNSMKRISKEELDTKKALKSLPPLIKGYLRVGAWIGEEAVIDRQFGTTDVLIILPVANINPRYINYFGT